MWDRRPVWLVTGLFVGGLVGAGGVILLIEEDPPPEKPAPVASSDVPAELARDLARRFRPWLRFDTEERWRPVDIRRLMDEKAHRICKRTPGAEDACDRVDDFAEFAVGTRELGAFADESFLDIAGDEPQGYASPMSVCRPERPLLDCDIGPSSAIYYRVLNANDRYYVDYWWFLRFNDSTGTSFDHEGDWEGVTAVTAPGSETVLDYVSFASHEGRFRYVAADLERHEGERVDVFVANGSHAAYPHRCAGKVCWQLLRFKRIAQRPERRFDGKAEWGRNPDDECFSDEADPCLRELPRLADDPQRTWTIWAGLWGATCGTRCGGKGSNAPASPGRQDRYSTPWCSTTDRGRHCDSTALTCDAWLGPLVSLAVCEPTLPDAPLSTQARASRVGPVVTANGAQTQAQNDAGVLQVLGGPLTPDDHVSLAGIARDRVQVVVRARNTVAGGRIAEVRFADLAGLREPVSLLVEEGESHPTVQLKPVEGAARMPDDVRTFAPLRDAG